MPRNLTFAASLAAISLLPRLAQAGMPSITFSDVARLRLQTISFFLMGLLISAGVIMLIWNSLRRDFAWLPRLSYPKACGLVLLWGLLFVVVLTMISGARELLTPGAWGKNGLTYKLRSAQEPEVTQTDPFQLRREKLIALGKALREHAENHDGLYPASTAAADGIPTTTWDLNNLPGTSYIYVPGRHTRGEPTILAYEPEVYSSHPQVLFTDGAVRPMGMDEILRQLEAKQ